MYCSCYINAEVLQEGLEQTHTGVSAREPEDAYGSPRPLIAVGVEALS
jgi:hypothetical protein